MKILIISPHPDDLEISMGGTAAKLVDEGNKIRSIILTDGHRSPRTFKCSDEEMVKIRKKEGARAHEILGITDFEYFPLPNAEDEVRVKAILKKELKKGFDRVYVPHPEDMHPTHQLVAKYVLDLIKEMKIKSEIWAYDGWNFLHNPDEFVDIEKYIDKKDRAIKAHASQIKDKPYDEAAEKLARVRAILMDTHNVTNVKYVEAFKRLR